MNGNMHNIRNQRTGKGWHYFRKAWLVISVLLDPWPGLWSCSEQRQTLEDGKFRSKSQLLLEEPLAVSCPKTAASLVLPDCHANELGVSSIQSNSLPYGLKYAFHSTVSFRNTVYNQSPSAAIQEPQSSAVLRCLTELRVGKLKFSIQFLLDETPSEGMRRRVNTLGNSP